jgi:hypothetical protein
MAGMRGLQPQTAVGPCFTTEGQTRILAKFFPSADSEAGGLVWQREAELMSQHADQGWCS